MSYLRRLSEAHHREELSREELSHYARHILLPGFGTPGQLKLKTARVLVIGAGGLGCPVLQALAGAGVGQLTVMDPDVVDRSNLSRQWLHTYDDVGRNKAESAAEAVRRLNPWVRIDVIGQAFDAKNGPEQVEAHDVVVDATDDFAARRWIDEACSKADRPWVHGALYRDHFQVVLFWSRHGARYRDLYPEHANARDCAQAGVLGATAALAGNWQAWEVIKLITGSGVVNVGTLVSVHVPSYTLSKFSIPGASTPELFQDATEADRSHAWSADRLKQALSIHEPVLLVDLREPELHAGSTLPGAQSYSPEAILEDVSNLPEDRLICFFCENGLVSGMLADALNAVRSGKPVVHLEGGYETW